MIPLKRYINSFFYYLLHPWRVVSIIKINKINRNLEQYNDEVLLKKKFKLFLGYNLDLNHPKSFNEKLQWLKLFDRKNIYTKMADKYEVRKVVAEAIGEKILIPIYGVYDSPDLIDFESLPDKFVIKCNHNSGKGMFICKDKQKMDKKQIISNIENGLLEDYYLINREWPYKDISKKIIIEQYIEDSKGGLADYKIWCFNGKAKILMYCKDRFKNLKIDFYSLSPFKKLPIKRERHPNSHDELMFNNSIQKMIEIAETLSNGSSFLRVDLYCVNNDIYFGELTFFPGAGFERFKPKKWDYIFGEMIKLPLQGAKQ